MLLSVYRILQPDLNNLNIVEMHSLQFYPYTRHVHGLGKVNLYVSIILFTFIITTGYIFGKRN